MTQKYPWPLFPPIVGVGRDAENDKAVILSAARPLTDDELRALHDYLNNQYCQSEFEFRARLPGKPS